jgi:hypothetical protein
VEEHVSSALYHDQALELSQCIEDDQDPLSLATALALIVEQSLERWAYSRLLLGRFLPGNTLI